MEHGPNISHANNERQINSDKDRRENDDKDRDEHKPNHPGEPPGRIIHPKPTHGDYAVRARLAKSAKAMAEVCSGFSYNESKTVKGFEGIWIGKVQPIRAIDDIEFLLDDLAHDRPVFCVGTEIRHLPQCTARHSGHALLPDPTKLLKEFEIKVVWQGLQAVPRAFVLSPSIRANKRIHMWSDGAVCAFLASTCGWRWHTDTVADLVPDILIWLIKWSVYDQTNLWIGSQHSNTPQYHLNVVRPKSPCWCGRGNEYRKCHRNADMIAAGFEPDRKRLRGQLK